MWEGVGKCWVKVWKSVLGCGGRGRCGEVLSEA